MSASQNRKWRQLLKEWGESESVIAIWAVVLLFAMFGAAAVIIYMKAKPLLFNYITFSVPCIAAVAGGVGLYFDRKGNAWAKRAFVASYVSLFSVFVYYVLAYPGMPKSAGAGLAMTMLGIGTFANLVLVINEKTRTGTSIGLLVAHVAVGLIGAFALRAWVS